MTANKPRLTVSFGQEITRISLFLFALFLAGSAMAQTGSFNNIQIHNNLRLKGKTIYQFSNDSAFVAADSNSVPTAWAVKAFVLNRLGNITIATGNTYVVGSQAAMLALDAGVGDVAVRSDSSKSFILQSLPANQLSNWILLLFPNNVPSVFGRTGPVVAADNDYDYTQIGGLSAQLATKQNTIPNLSDTSKYAKKSDSAIFTSVYQNSLKADDNQVVHKSMDENIYSQKTFMDSVKVPTKPNGDSSKNAASTEFVKKQIALIPPGSGIDSNFAKNDLIAYSDRLYNWNEHNFNWRYVRNGRIGADTLNLDPKDYAQLAIYGTGTVPGYQSLFNYWPDGRGWSGAYTGSYPADGYWARSTAPTSTLAIVTGQFNDSLRYVVGTNAPAGVNADTLTMIISGSIPALMQLNDHYLNTSTPITRTGTTQYIFSIDNSIPTTRGERFSITFTELKRGRSHIIANPDSSGTPTNIVWFDKDTMRLAPYPTGSGSSTNRNADSLASHPGSYYAPVSSVPTLLSQLTNDPGYITTVAAQTFGSLLSKPTTLSGYGITDAYPLSGNPSGFLTAASITGKVNYTDTAAALNPYLRKNDTTGKWISPAVANATYATIANLALKANDNAVVHLAGNETAVGNKIFFGNIGVRGTQPVPSEDVGLWSNVKGAGGSGGVLRSGQFYSNYTGTNAFVAGDFYATDSTSTSNYDHVVSVQGFTNHLGSGTVNNAWGAKISGNNSGGNIANAYGYYWGGWTGAGTYTRKYSFYSTADTLFNGGAIIGSSKFAFGSFSTGAYQGLFNGINPIYEYQNSGITTVYMGAGSTLFSGANNNDFGIMQNNASRYIYLGVNGVPSLKIGKTTTTFGIKAAYYTNIPLSLGDSLVLTHKKYVDSVNATKEPAITKNTAFNKNFGITTGTVMDAQRIIDSLTAINARLQGKLDSSYRDTTLLGYPFQQDTVNGHTRIKLSQTYQDSLMTLGSDQTSTGLKRFKNIQTILLALMDTAFNSGAYLYKNPNQSSAASTFWMPSSSSDTLATKSDMSRTIANRNYANDSIAITDGGLHLWDYYRTGGDVKVVATVPQYANLNYVIHYDGGANDSTQFYFAGSSAYAMTVDWGDGSSNSYSGSAGYTPTHKYTTAGDYIVQIKGTGIYSSIQYFWINNYPYQSNITSVNNLALLTNAIEVDLSLSELLSNTSGVFAYPSTLHKLSLYETGITDFSRTYTLPAGLTELDLNQNNLTSSTIDSVLIWLDSLTFNAGAKTLLIRQNNVTPPTSASSAALSSLISKGWTISHD